VRSWAFIAASLGEEEHAANLIAAVRCLEAISAYAAGIARAYWVETIA
jgi:hypothetical protein